MNKLHSDLIKPEMFRQNPDGDHAMSIFLYRAVVARSGFGQTGPKSEMQFEQDMFETMGVHLARKTRRERLVRFNARFTAAWTNLVDRVTRPGLGAQAQKALLERLQGMPSHTLKDIGVARNNAGRF